MTHHQLTLLAAPDPRNTPDTYIDQRGNLHHTQAKAAKIANQKMVRNWRLRMSEPWPASRWGRVKG